MPPHQPDHLYGLHDPGGEHLMREAGCRGWILFTEAIGSDPNDGSGGNYGAYAAEGFGVMVRLNNGYPQWNAMGPGTIPPSSQYESFARRCGAFAGASQGAHIWIIGNEMNMAAERPGVYVDTSRGAAIPRGDAVGARPARRAEHLCADPARRLPDRPRGRSHHAGAVRPLLHPLPQRHSQPAGPRRRPGAHRLGGAVECQHGRLGAIPARHPHPAGAARLRRRHDPHLHPRPGAGAGSQRPHDGAALRPLPLQLLRLSRFHGGHPGQHAPPAGLHHRDRPGRRVERPAGRVAAPGLRRDRQLEPAARQPADPGADPLPLAAARSLLDGAKIEHPRCPAPGDDGPAPLAA